MQLHSEFKFNSVISPRPPPRLGPQSWRWIDAPGTDYRGGRIIQRWRGSSGSVRLSRLL